MPSKKIKPNSVTSAQEFNSDELIKELSTIRKLIVILLVKLGSDSGEIGKALDIPPRTLRDWISFNGIDQITQESDQKENKSKKQKPKKIKKTKIEEKPEPITSTTENG